MNVFTPTPRITRIQKIEFTPPKIPIIYQYKKPKYYETTPKLTKAEKKRINKQRRAYTSSVASYQLGIYGKPKKRQEYSGLEIRPMVYPKQNNKIINLLGG